MRNMRKSGRKVPVGCQATNDPVNINVLAAWRTVVRRDAEVKVLFGAGRDTRGEPTARPSPGLGGQIPTPVEYGSDHILFDANLTDEDHGRCDAQRYSPSGVYPPGRGRDRLAHARPVLHPRRRAPVHPAVRYRCRGPVLDGHGQRCNQGGRGLPRHAPQIRLKRSTAGLGRPQPHGGPGPCGRRHSASVHRARSRGRHAERVRRAVRRHRDGPGPRPWKAPRGLMLIMPAVLGNRGARHEGGVGLSDNP